MSSQQKRGFRLPWVADHAPDEGAAAAATLDQESIDSTNGVDSDDLGEGPFRLAGASPTLTTDPAPAESDVPEESAEAAMIDVDSTATESSETPTEAVDASPNGNAWPVVDRQTSPQHAIDAERAAARPAIHAVGESPVPRRENPLVAGLVKAMREAAIASREETLGRLDTEAEARVQGIRGRATSEAAELKQRAETDISEIRDWSKAEIARIREKTENRIEARKTELVGETERHAASVERLVGEVQAVVETFHADMNSFFERLLAENDPARLAALAEQAPDTPDLTGDGPAALDLLDGPVVDSLEPDAAAAAEVAASEGLDMRAVTEWPATVSEPENEAEAQVDDDGATRLLVTGLTSVAGISSFKGALGQLPGVHAVTVSSGDPGVFVFAISHDPEIDLATGVASIAGFSARITDATETGITVVAHEPAA